MRKIIIIGSAHPLRGGLAAFNERLAKEFQSEGDQVILHTFSLQYPSLLFPGKTQLSSEPAPEGLPIYASVNSINPLNWLKTGRKLRRENADLVIIKYWMPFMAPALGSIARLIRKNKKSRIICIADNIIPHEKRPGDTILTRYFIKSVDGFVVMSAQVGNDLKHFDPGKPVKTCPHPLFDNFGKAVDKVTARKNLGIDPEGKYLLFFGIIRDYKGLDLMLQALNEKILKEQSIKLIIAGEFYSDPEPHMKYIRENGLTDKIVMHNHFISDSQVYNYFCAADLVVQPYKSATQSGVTQIAYHFDKPMVVTNVGGLPELIPDNVVGYVVEPRSGPIAEAVNKFFADSKEDTFIENIRQEKLKYSWKRMVDTISELSLEIKK